VRDLEPRTGSVNPTSTGQLANVFSVDVEDYYQVSAFEDTVSREDWTRFEPRVERNTHRILDILSDRDTRATFFILGWVAEHCPPLIREIADRGHELASHGYDHQRITSQTPEQFRADIAKTKRILEDSAGIEVVGYRAPTYSIVHETLWALEVILEEGYLYDSSIFPIRHDRYGIPKADRFPSIVKSTNGSELWEFPISTIRLAGLNLPFVGGGYMRQLPWTFVRWGMRRLNTHERQPAMVYIHPWELDPEQPRLDAGMLNGIRHYRNLAATKQRLSELLLDFEFTTARTALGL